MNSVYVPYRLIVDNDITNWMRIHNVLYRVDLRDRLIRFNDSNDAAKFKQYFDL